MKTNRTKELERALQYAIDWINAECVAAPGKTIGTVVPGCLGVVAILGRVLDEPTKET